VDRLVDAGLHSPSRVVEAGLSALQELSGIGETKASAILAAAQAWVAEHPELPADSAEPEGPAVEDGGSEIEPTHLRS
jgi:hypothetical protein